MSERVEESQRDREVENRKIMCWAMRVTLHMFGEFCLLLMTIDWQRATQTHNNNNISRYNNTINNINTATATATTTGTQPVKGESNALPMSTDLNTPTNLSPLEPSWYCCFLCCCCCRHFQCSRKKRKFRLRLRLRRMYNKQTLLTLLGERTHS